MATPNEKLAESLELLKKLQDQGLTAIKSSEIGRTDRERLLKNGFLREVLKGWYIISSSDEKTGDTTSWYASYWKFCARYLSELYGDDYFISPDQSLQILSGNLTVPKQLLVRSAKNTNYGTDLLSETSIWHWDSPMPENAQVLTWEGIRMMDLPSSLIYCTSSVFTKNSTDVRTALAMIRDASELTPQLLQGGHTTIAGRLAGAFRNIGRDRIADDIAKTMQAADYPVREVDPFETPSPVSFSSRELSPYVNRIKLMWYQMRDVIISRFPKAPGLPANQEQYIKQVEEIYRTDAYNSLSIERYIVTPELIERVKSGTWNTESSEEDRKQKDAMAARGYWQATQKVRESIKKVLNGANAGKVADDDHGDWYRELFTPSVAAGIIEAYSLAGYRNRQVYISNSQHTPLNNDAVRDVMPEFFELLKNEPEASVRAVLGHFIFVFIHPYMDGNGRTGRFLMNVMLASGGYPWTVIPVEERDRYMKALEKASVEQNITDFAEYIAYLVQASLNGTPVAKPR